MNDRVRRVHCSNGFCEFDSHTTTKYINMNTIKEQIELLTTVKLILEIDGRKSDWKVEDELELIQLKCKYYNINTTYVG